jgi:NADPH-dependent F420 reductase
LSGGEISGGANDCAVREAELAVLSVPYAAHGATLGGLKGELAGKILIDISVPLKPPKLREVVLPEGKSAALEAQALLGPETPVVATLHHVSSVHLADLEHAMEGDVLACADDKRALELALGLISDLGLRGFDAGPLVNSIALESLTPVLLHLNKRYRSAGVGIRLTGV